jgi:hypothetical protein
MKKETPNPDDIKTDLKHDTMEFSASTDGDDQLDTDDERYEEEGISPEELDLLEDAPFDEEAAALDSVETDRIVDEDNLPEEDWTDDLGLDDGDDETAPDHHRTEP